MPSKSLAFHAGCLAQARKRKVVRMGNDSSQSSAERLGLFRRTGFRLSEEDRVTNAMMITLQHATTPLTVAFLNRLGCAVEDTSQVQIREHVRYDRENTIDAELRITGQLVVAVENKVYAHQLDNTDQAKRYLKLLSTMREARRVLLLLSPDGSAPPSVGLPGQNEACCIKWLPWSGVCSWLRDQVKSAPASAALDHYLLSELVDYLEYLGLSFDRRHPKRSLSAFEPKLDGVLANRTTERILMQVMHFGSVYVRQLAAEHGVGGVQRQLRQLESCGVLLPRRVGNTLAYFFNEDYPYLGPLLALVRAAYEGMTPAERAATFGD